MKRTWWKEAVVYQVYPRSFYDTDGDGLGDLKGVFDKLDYLEELGVDIIWLSPMYKSPNVDNGYDVSDYYDIMEEMGTMEDFDRLLEEVHARGMKMILDLVLNHTSDQHPWFIESRSSRGSEKRDWYVWRDEPTNWESIFSGPAWTYEEKTGQYYLHLYAEAQPDLNWENPEVRQALYEMINWWSDKGVDGYRVDAISHIKKDYSDMPNPEGKEYVPAWEKMTDVEGIHDFLAEMKEQTFSKYDLMTVGEANGVTPEEIDEWISEENGKLDMVFQFQTWYLRKPDEESGVNVTALKEILTRWQKEAQDVGWNALYVENHDRSRIVSTWGDDGRYWRESALAIAFTYFFMQGTPFIYQGQEIGMTNVDFDTIDFYDDIKTLNLYRYKRAEGLSHEAVMKMVKKSGRDHSRTPMQWTDGENAGFSTGSPWLEVNPNYKWINVENQKNDPQSIFSFYKKMIALRKEKEVLIYGTYELEEVGCPSVYAYVREDSNEKLLIISNLSGEPCIWNAPRNADLLLGNYETVNHVELQPFEARVYQLRI
ncbi:glycoside hydrolase family 13 protein [Planococcus salinus]|uniref:Alpha-amylase n=1 Tax=Planococcus salinus TaxID=1848460 RepID=A0A3M8P5W2_9BACL|nr:alpha-glucosidase [Planococcus salinus]RNF39057.1 alpha-glucosidase [Planococcus salinus]